MSKIFIEIDLDNDYEVNLKYEGKKLDDGEKLMLILATKSMEDLVYDNFNLVELIEMLSDE